VTVLLWAVSFGAHACALAAARARHHTLRRSASWAEYWQGQLVGFLRQIAFEAIAALALLALVGAEGLLVLKATGDPSRGHSEAPRGIAQGRAALGPRRGDPSNPGL